VTDVVATLDDAAALGRPPLIVLEPLEAYLDAAGLGAGPIAARAVGDGHSNVTYALTRGAETFVLRRPPRPPLPPSAHDVLREARLLERLHAAGARVPAVLAACEDEQVIGAPFYIMPFVAGDVLTDLLPACLDGPRVHRARIGLELVDALVEIHAVDIHAAGLDSFSRPGGYLERQLRRFRGLLEHSATRPLPDLERVSDWLEANRPESGPVTVVHGDYRLGNVMFQAADPVRLTAVLDWELAALGDPLADLGYLTATWAEPDDPHHAMLALSGVTRGPGFLTRAELVRRYELMSGRAADALAWYQVLALWKAAIFLEGNYRRYRLGMTDDPYYAGLGRGIPELAAIALQRAVN
jgi:aminoglycoside phosphotransferase (APT) family kinase protein